MRQTSRYLLHTDCSGSSPCRVAPLDAGPTPKRIAVVSLAGTSCRRQATNLREFTLLPYPSDTQPCCNLKDQPSPSKNWSDIDESDILTRKEPLCISSICTPGEK